MLGMIKIDNEYVEPTYRVLQQHQQQNPVHSQQKLKNTDGKCARTLHIETEHCGLFNRDCRKKIENRVTSNTNTSDTAS